ncbi:hypothetical protein [Henriciella aquimarina]|uniref:hypothetical protein n=1 Tax=Henriciella aquimarina TaxID=545261 RepID=UPI000A00D714|nr:hypothetical protein [Henriciella aquimarina]
MKKLIILVAVMLAGCGGGEAKFQSACVDAIKKRLKAPSTFELIEATADHQKVPLPAEQVIRAELESLEDRDDIDSRVRQARLRSDLARATSGEQYKATNLRLYIEYDAQNSMGVPLRGAVICTVEGGPNGEFSADDGWNVEIDGETHTDWIVNQVKRGQ